MKKYIGAVLSIATIGMLFYLLFDLKEQVKQIPVLETQVDSLNMELFNEKVDAGRHEITREDFLQVKYPKIYKEYEEYLSKKTE